MCKANWIRNTVTFSINVNAEHHRFSIMLLCTWPGGRDIPLTDAA